MSMSRLAALTLALTLIAPTPRHPAARLAGAPYLARVVAPGGQPDDLAVDAHGRLIWGDLARGTVLAFDGRRVLTLASGLSVPEGIVPLPDGTLVVAEQGRDRLV